MRYEAKRNEDITMSKIQKVLVTGKTHTTASDAAGLSHSHDGNLNITLSTPGNASAREHAFLAVEPHPTAEQLFAGAWSACYIAAVGIVAKERQVVLPPETAADIEVDLGMTGKEYFIQARLNLIVPGVDYDTALAIAHGAEQMCPYSKAIRGNIDVALNVVTA